MKSRVDVTRNPTDIAKWSAVALLVGIGVVGNQYYSAESLLYRVLALVALGGLAVSIALTTAQGAAFVLLVKEARMEIRKVVWPTRPETMQTTLIVLGVVLLAALILWGLDSLLGFFASKIIG